MQHIKQFPIHYLTISLLLASCILPLAIIGIEGNSIASNSYFAANPMIKAIEVEGLTRMREGEFIDLLGLHVGDEMDVVRLRQGIKRAFKKGIFLDIKAMSEDYDDGIKLRYIIKELPIIRHIMVSGNTRVSTSDIKKAFLFKEGEDFREEIISRAERELISLYHRKGFPNVRLDIRAIDAGIGGESNNGRVDIKIEIDEGTPLIIRSIDILPEVRGYIHLTEGSVFDMDVLEEDIKGIEEFYRGEGYIRPIIGPYIFQDGELIIPIKPGQRLEITFEGNEVVGTKRLLKLLTIPEYEEMTDEQINDLINNIKRYYMGMGYYHIQVAAGIERQRDLIRLRFFIAEGKRVILRNIRFEGATISTDILNGVIPLKVGEPYNATLLEESKSLLKGFYNALGYLYMDVIDVREHLNKEGDEVTLEFSINEGTQINIGAIKITGNSLIDESVIMGVLKLREGSPYNAIDIGDARNNILSLYRSNGFLDTNVEVESIINNNRAEVNFVINEGRPSYIGKVIIRGNQKTKDKVIMREIRLKEGGVYNYDELIKIREGLFKLGIFDEVSIDLVDPVEEDGKVIRDMLITIKEANAGRVDVSIGYSDYERLRGSVEIDYLNLGGYNREVGLRLEMSNVQNKYTLNLRDPWFFNRPNLPFIVSLVNENRRAINLDTREVLYKVKKSSFIAGTERQIRKGLNAGINYEYSSVETTDVEPGVILTREDTGTVDISSISTFLFYDTRDNPFDPTSGSLNGAVLKFASKALLSETEFIKGIIQSSWYYRMGKGIVFAFSLKGGLAHAFGETKELPLIERFFLGGRTTVRGYSQDTLGPKGEGDTPTGGNLFALVNAEFRIPIRKNIGIVTFIDGGNVWKAIDDLEPELRYTVGMGLRYRTPVGPIRIDYGYKLDRLPDEGVGELHFSIGHAF
ncbi:MAG: outer membrane protein assembly factor [Thermodesulfovibrionia bacterium]